MRGWPTSKCSAAPGRRCTVTRSTGASSPTPLSRPADSIDSQEEVGGWPDLPGGQPPRDSNGDGVPDDHAVSIGLRRRRADWLHQSRQRPNPSGELSARSGGPPLRPAGVQSVRRSWSRLDARRATPKSRPRRSPSGLTKLAPGSVVDATLSLTFERAAGPLTLAVYGVDPDPARQEPSPVRLGRVEVPAVERGETVRFKQRQPSGPAQPRHLRRQRAEERHAGDRAGRR